MGNASTFLAVRHKLYVQLDPTAWPRPGLSLANRFICVLILASIIFAVLETEPSLEVDFEDSFFFLEWLLTATFIGEYMARLWVCTENPKYRGWTGRLRYVYS